MREKITEFVLADESRTVTLTKKIPATVGVPESTPPGDMLSPAGSPVALHVKPQSRRWR